MTECALSEWRVHHHKLTSYEQLVRSALGLGCGSCTKWIYEIWHEGYAGWKYLRLGGSINCCRLVCCHGNDVAHSLNLSTSLSFFPREYGVAFKELCNSGTNGTEHVGDARSNKDQRDVHDVEECMYAMICSTWVMFGPSNEHNHSSKGINRSWEFYELHPGQKQSYLHWFY